MAIKARRPKRTITLTQHTFSSVVFPFLHSCQFTIIADREEQWEKRRRWCGFSDGERKTWQWPPASGTFWSLSPQLLLSSSTLAALQTQRTSDRGKRWRCQMWNSLEVVFSQGKHKEGHERSHWDGYSWRERSCKNKVKDSNYNWNINIKPPFRVASGTRLIWENEARERR